MVGSLCWNCWWLAMASKVWVFRAFIFECNKASQHCRGSTGVPWNLSLMCGRATWSAFRAGWHKASYLEKYVSTTVAILKTKSIPSSSTCPGWKPAGTAVSFRPVPLFSFGISEELPWIYDCFAVSTWASDKHWHPFRTAHYEIPGLVFYKWSTSTCSALDQGNDQLGQHYSLPDWRLAQRGPIHIPFVVGGVQVLEWGLVWWWPTLSWWRRGCGSKQIHQDSLYLWSLAFQRWCCWSGQLRFSLLEALLWLCVASFPKELATFCDSTKSTCDAPPLFSHVGSFCFGTCDVDSVHICATRWRLHR